jgi:hypothetical protein
LEQRFELFRMLFFVGSIVSMTRRLVGSSFCAALDVLPRTTPNFFEVSRNAPGFSPKVLSAVTFPFSLLLFKTAFDRDSDGTE